MSGITTLVVTVLIMGAWTRSLPAKESGVGEALTEQQRSKTKAVGDTLTLDEVQEMIVGTWIEDVAEKLGNHKKGDLKWVFAEDGKIRKYRNGSRYATQDYAVVGKYDGQQGL